MKKIGLPMQMGIGMVLGIAVGMLASSMGWSAAYFQPFGQLFINLIRMVVVPLVFVTLVAGAASVGDVRSLGRIASKTLVYYLVTTTIAIIIGLILANCLNPGIGLDLATDNLKARDVTPPAMSDVLLGIVPINPMDALAKGNMLQIIFFAVLIGLCINMCGERTKVVSGFFDGMSEIMIKVTTIVMLYAPIGVFALMAVTVTNHGIAVLLPLIKLVGIMYLASLCQILFIYIPCVRFSGIKAGKFFKILSAPLMIAFTTCSSAAALSANLIGVQKLGASKQVSSFSIPLGNTINMDGAAIYMGIVSIFAAQVYGIPMPLEKQVTIVIMAILASIGSMGVPGAALIMITMIFTQAGIPLEAIALVAGVDRIMDMARTTINVLGDATGAVFVSKLENDLDQERGDKFEG